MKQININGINVIDYNENNLQSIIFVHAFPMSSKMWDEQVKYFKDKYRIITFDIRGFGESEKEFGSYTTDSHADDVLEMIRHLNLTKPVICGLSMGGYIALRTLEKAQDIFKAAVLCDTKSEADTDEAKLKRAEQIKQIKSGNRDLFVQTFIENTLSPNSINATHNNVFNRVKSIIDEQTDKSICSALMTLASRTDTTGFLEKIMIPVLIIVGENDNLTPPENAFSLNKKISKSTVVTIQGAGHFTNIESPERFNNILEQFLNKLI